MLKGPGKKFQIAYNVCTVDPFYDISIIQYICSHVSSKLPVYDKCV